MRCRTRRRWPRSSITISREHAARTCPTARHPSTTAKRWLPRTPPSRRPRRRPLARTATNTAASRRIPACRSLRRASCLSPTCACTRRPQRRRSPRTATSAKAWGNCPGATATGGWWAWCAIPPRSSSTGTSRRSRSSSPSPASDLPAPCSSCSATDRPSWRASRRCISTRAAGTCATCPRERSCASSCGRWARRARACCGRRGR